MRRNKSALDRQEQHADGDQGDADPVLARWTLAKEGKCQEDDEHDAKFVDRRDLLSFPKFERAEIADPGGAGRQA